ncbi:CAP domain-containing protein [Desulforegula conservatrix]|uniref:CAP domain-containing protein n=1 Tax=Desulforegula conservatrix TaxID=153026 RepID=UPI0012EB6CFE|nr:hypothetical protein [Desulforegula conservatrix]
MANKIFFLIFITLTINGVALAGETTALSAPMSASIFKKINEFRDEPYKKIKEFAEKERIADKLPEWVEGLNGTRLPRLNFNSELIGTSSAHIDDMANRNYFSERSPEGVGVSERLGAAGINNQLSRESIGIVLFRNYIDPVLAEDSVFTTLIKYELSKQSLGDTLVFNSAITDMAVSVKSSTYKVQGRFFNSYIAVMDGIKSDNNTARMEIASKLIVLINQARQKPLKIMESHGMDISSYVETLSYEKSFPSLFKIDYKADEFTKYGINRLPESEYYGISKNNINIEPIVNFRTSLIKDISQNTEPSGTQGLNHYNVNMITEEFFSELLKSDLSPENQKTIILNQDLNKVYAESNINQVNEGENIKSEIVLNLSAWNEISEQYYSAGVIFVDADGDNLYDPGEEKSLEQILFFDKGIHARTDLSGGYYLNIDDPSFWLVIFDEEKGLVIHPNKINEFNGFSLVDLNAINQ